jgi:hypothetical protein
MGILGEKEMEWLFSDIAVLGVDTVSLIALSVLTITDKKKEILIPRFLICSAQECLSEELL